MIVEQLIDELSTLVRQRERYYALVEEHDELRRKYNALLDSSVKHANESTGLMLACVLNGKIKQ